MSRPQVRLRVAWQARTQSPHHRQHGSLIAHNVRWEKIGKVTRHAGVTACASEAEHHTLCLDTLCLLPENLALIFLLSQLCQRKNMNASTRCPLYTKQRSESPQCCVYVSPVSVKLSPCTCHAHLCEAPTCWERITTNLCWLCGSEHLLKQRLATNCLSAGANSQSSPLQHLVLWSWRLVLVS